MVKVIRPRIAAWEAREAELCEENALWEEQERLYVAMAIATDPDRQSQILEKLDATYELVAQRGWQADWERRSYAVPDAQFSDRPVPEHLRFPRTACLPAEEPAEVEEEDQIELELELH